MNPQSLGLPLVIIATIITSIGVILNNCLLVHTQAMIVWSISNTLFAVFFYGRWRGWWDGGLADEIMCGMYLMMLSSGIYGLWQAGVL